MERCVSRKTTEGTECWYPYCTVCVCNEISREVKTLLDTIVRHERRNASHGLVHY